ncbi:MAG: hypothetical protein RR370_00955 [Synergistaceae bacterium]
MDKIYQLTNALHNAKMAEDEAKKKRIALEEELATAIEVPNDFEGSRTREVENFKVCVKRSMNIKIDVTKLHEIETKNSISKEDMDKAFRWKAELNKKPFEALPESTRTVLAEAITKTPGKVSITVEKKSEEE